MKVRLTRALMRNTKPHPERTTLLWDTDQYGFGLIVQPSGAKSFFFSYTLPRRRSPRRVVLGRAEAITLDQARRMARDLREQVATGSDPVQERREAEAEPTVADLSARFLTTHVGPKLRPSSARLYRQVLAALPENLKRTRVADVTGDHIARLHASMRDRPYLANRTLAVLRKMFGLAERWQLCPRGSNPASGHDPYPERLDRGSRFTDEQLAAVGRSLEEIAAENRYDFFALALVRLNLFTGWRPIEVRSLRWSEVDLKKRVVTLRATKTGTRSGFLGRPAAEILASLPRVAGSPFCFPGRGVEAHLDMPKRLWEEVQRRADLPHELRFYDLVRHTYNTVAQEAGVAPEMVRVLVGHVPTSISARYTHFALHRTLAAADQAASAVERLLFPLSEPEAQHEGSEPDFNSTATLGPEVPSD